MSNIDFSSLKDTIPENPGIYIMKNSEGKIIYIGKAKNLRKRMSSYFTKKNRDDWKTIRLVEKITSFEYIITKNEIEAFLLESNLIKKYRPDYNIELKDQQRYTYLKITNERFPRLLVVRRNRKGEFNNSDGKIYGPFVYGSSKFLTTGFLRKLFKIRICDRLPKKPCLEYFINNCDAPCIDKISEEDYNSNIKKLESILEEKQNIEIFIKEMEIEMKKASDIQDFEKAKNIRDTLYRLKNLIFNQTVETLQNNGLEDYFGIMYDNSNRLAYVMRLSKIHGVIHEQNRFSFELIGDNNFSGFLFQFYSNNINKIPRYIYVNQKPESKENLERSLEKIKNEEIKIISLDDLKNDNDLDNKTDYDDKMKIFEIINKNLNHQFQIKQNPSLIEIKNSLKLDNLPRIIDCFDISNLGTSILVGSCIRFVNGQPLKSGYRRFKVKWTKNRQNDFMMIYEIVIRRYQSLLENKNKKSDNEHNLPDLIIIDGGKGQLKYAKKALNELCLDIDIISIAKENEELFIPNKEESIILSKNNIGLKTIQYCRDEAHRFALAYNQKLRKL